VICKLMNNLVELAVLKSQFSSTYSVQRCLKEECYRMSGALSLVKEYVKLQMRKVFDLYSNIDIDVDVNIDIFNICLKEEEIEISTVHVPSDAEDDLDVSEIYLGLAAMASHNAVFVRSKQVVPLLTHIKHHQSSFVKTRFLVFNPEESCVTRKGIKEGFWDDGWANKLVKEVRKMLGYTDDFGDTYYNTLTELHKSIFQHNVVRSDQVITIAEGVPIRVELYEINDSPEDAQNSSFYSWVEEVMTNGPKGLSKMLGIPMVMVLQGYCLVKFSRSVDLLQNLYTMGINLDKARYDKAHSNIYKVEDCLLGVWRGKWVMYASEGGGVSFDSTYTNHDFGEYGECNMGSYSDR